MPANSRRPDRRGALQPQRRLQPRARRSSSGCPASTRRRRSRRPTRCRSTTSAGTRAARNEPIVVIDAETGERWPIWVEIDSNASTPSETALLIHPARNFAAEHRYIVALREPDGPATGKPIPAPDGLPLLPRRPALRSSGDQRAARALREHLQDAAQGRDQARRASTSPGTSPSPATRTSPPGCSTSATTPSRSSATRTSPTAWWQGPHRLHRDLGRELHSGRGPGDGAAGAGNVHGALLPAAGLRAPAAASSSTRTGCRARTATGRPTSTA